MRNSENTDGVTLLITLEFMTISKTISRIIYQRLAILFLIHHFYARSQIFATRYANTCYTRRPLNRTRLKNSHVRYTFDQLNKEQSISDIRLPPSNPNGSSLIN